MDNAYKIDRVRWSRFSIFEQMGNIGSEVGRTFNAGSRNDHAAVKQATARALDLFEATTEPLIAQRSPRAKEVALAKDEFLQIVSDQAFTSSQAKSLDRYFMHYALAARANR